MALSLMATTASAKEFSYVENFDNVASSGNVLDLPDGWKSTGNSELLKVYGGSYIGSGAHSGSYVMATLQTSSAGRSAWAFSKMLSLKGGTTYTVKFWLKMPGGSAPVFNNNVVVKAATAQSEEAATTELGETGDTKIADWTEKTYEFTPAADGDYCIAFNVKTNMYMASYVAIDDFEMTGDEPDGGGTVEEQETLLEENFDDASEFPGGAIVPDGWKSTGTYPFARQTASYFGLDAHSGSYVFGTPSSSSSMSRDEFFCTKKLRMKAGKEYTLSFWYKAPGGASDVFTTSVLTRVGTQQEYNSMTKTLGETTAKRMTEWEQVTYKFTPDVDGEYCFGFNLTTMLYNSGAVAIDDITVTGPKDNTGGDLDPDKVVCELPYSQSFDNENKDYDGQHYVPNGWMAVGSAPFVTTNYDDLKAKDGTWYVVAPESTVARDDRLYTSFFKLEKGTTYTAKFWLYMPGDNGLASNFDFTVGTEQDKEFHTSLLSLENYTNTAWTEQTVHFTPEETDYYCFSFALGGESARAGEVCLDLFTLNAEGQAQKPRAAFSYNGYFNIMDNSLVAFDKTKVQMVNQTKDGESYLWTAEGAVPETSEEENPVFTFPASGTYTIKLTAKNASGESTTSESVDVSLYGEKTEQMPVAVYNPSEDNLWTRDNMLAYDTDLGADWVTGINHYYTHFAEKFDLPEGHDYTIGTITTYLCYYNIANRYYDQQASLPFKIVVYGDKDGRPDLNNVYGTYESTMRGVFGTLGLGKAEMRGIPFDKPIVAKGPFYVAFEFDKNVWISEPDANLSRTAVGFGGFKHRSGETTFYVQPTAVPATSNYVVDGQYCPVDSIDAQYKGLGLNLVAWLSADKQGTVGMVAVNPDGGVAFATRLDGNVLTVSGTHEGETVTVCNAAGQVVATATAKEQSTSLTLDAQPGLYIVSAKAGSQKFIKK